VLKDVRTADTNSRLMNEAPLDPCYTAVRFYSASYLVFSVHHRVTNRQERDQAESQCAEDLKHLPIQHHRMVQCYMGSWPWKAFLQAVVSQFISAVETLAYEILSGTCYCQRKRNKLTNAHRSRLDVAITIPATARGRSTSARKAPIPWIFATC
jgi:hypothetical protein